MKIMPSRGYLALIFVFSLLLAGCGTITKVRLTGSPGARVSGHYRATHVSSDFSGPAAWQMNLTGHLEEFDFRKAAPEDSVDLDISQGRTVLVHATAEPGVPGLRVRNKGGWSVEKIK
jgi:hypothetical protein